MVVRGPRFVLVLDAALGVVDSAMARPRMGTPEGLFASQVSDEQDLNFF